MGKCHYFMTQRLQTNSQVPGCCCSEAALQTWHWVSKGAFQSHLCNLASFESTKPSCVLSLDVQGIMFWFLLTVFSIKTGLHCALWLKFTQHIISAIFTLYNDIFTPPPPPELLKGTVSKTKFQ